MPSWVYEGCKEYSKRFVDGISINMIEIPLLTRSKSSDIQRIVEKEASLIAQAIPQGSRVIALTIDGKSFTSEALAEHLEKIQHHHSHLCLIIGGPEGLSQDTLNRAEECWSLSKLTLPHPLVRIVLLETLYRAWSIINNHPYHK